MKTAEMKLRIKEKPFYQSWYNRECGFEDSILEKGEIDYSGLNDNEKFCLIVYAWNIADICPSRKTIKDAFNWTTYKVQKIFRETNEITITPTMSESTGLLSGSGYYYEKLNQ